MGVVPTDDFCVQQPASAAGVDLKIRRPVGGLAAGCTCMLGAAPIEEPPQDSEACAAEEEQEVTKSFSRAPPLQPFAGFPRGAPEVAFGYDSKDTRGLDAAAVALTEVAGTNPLPDYVRRELDKIGLACGLAELATVSH